MSAVDTVYQKLMEADHCSQWMGLELVEIGEGHCKMRMTVRREMLNGFGILHGGMAYAFASNAFGRVSVSINGSMSFAKSSKEGEILVAEAKALNVNHRTADFDVVIAEEKTGEQRYFFRGTVYRSSKEILASKE